MANILIVEDNADIGTLYQRVLSRHEIVLIDDVPNAVKYLGEATPDLLILDFHLPSGSGLSVLDYVRGQARFAKTPVIGISADDLLRKEAHGLNRFMAKPIEIDELFIAVQDLLAS